MCGFTFAYGVEDAVARTRQSLETMAHRGPDESGLEEVAGAVLGHARLSIIDLSASHQPFFTDDRSHVLSFNGELYNYQELRETLATRWTFRTQGDTEVLLAGLICEGESFLDRIDGMWAFAFWNARDRSLLLGRDRFGKKPLYYRSGNGDRQITAASELPALRKLTDAAVEEDQDSIADFFRYGFCLPSHTFYSDIREVAPGHLLKWSPGNRPSCQAWWTPPLPGSFEGTEQEAIVHLRDAFQTGVRNRLVADVEVGAFLSGGIDSSLVVAEAARMTDGSLHTFSIGFASADHDESRYARLVADSFKLRHTTEQVDALDEHALEETVRLSMGQPFGDPSLLPTELVSELAARHVKVVLSGDGADELFSGYQRYQARSLLRWYSRLPKSLRKLAHVVLQSIPTGRMHHSRSVIKKAQMFSELTETDHLRPYVAPRYFEDDALARLVPDLADRGHDPRLPEATNLDDLENMMRNDALVYLPQDILVKVDRAAMRHSLEVRAPFLGKDVAELAMSLPGSWQRGFMSGKQMLRTAFAEHLPASIWRRRKQGFAVPVGHWFDGGIGDRLMQLLQLDCGPVNADYVRSLLESHRRRDADHGLRLWIVYSFLAWKNQSWR